MINGRLELLKAYQNAKKALNDDERNLNEEFRKEEQQKILNDEEFIYEKHKDSNNCILRLFKKTRR